MSSEMERSLYVIPLSPVTSFLFQKKRRNLADRGNGLLEADRRARTESDMMDDEHRLLRALARRDRAAWSALYDHHVQEVFGFIYHLVGGDRHLAEELHQEVWLAALEGVDHFDARRGRFRDWLLGIARHRVSRRYRGRFSRSLEALAERAVQVQTVALPPPEQLEGLERADVIRAALLRLNLSYRDVLLKKYVEGLSVHEIAGRTGRSAKAVESLLSRARERLRELLRPYFVHLTQGDRHEPADLKQPPE
jgi:RNA polymerase sigma-70 factor, ECF subfamily